MKEVWVAVVLSVAGAASALAWLYESAPRPPSVVASGSSPAVSAVASVDAAASGEKQVMRDTEMPLLRDNQLDQAIARLGAQWPNFFDSEQREFEQAPDLYAFAQDAVVRASNGDGAAQYYLYVALEECRAYLRLEPAELAAFFEGMMNSASAYSSEERKYYEEEYQRCSAFAGADLSQIIRAMGTDVPRAETEYASVWFERALQSNYPLALANMATRSFPLTRAERLALLRQAATSGDPEVYRRLFLEMSEGGTETSVTAPALAWLIVACRAGADCRESALWHRVGTCSGGNSASCPRGESAIEHFWYSISARDREFAYRLAMSIEDCLRSSDLDHLPWPDFPVTDKHAWARD